MEYLKWQRAGWRECFLPRRNTHSGQWQAVGRSLGKVTNSHTPSLAVWTNTRSLDQRRRCWCAVLNCSGAQSAQSAATAGSQQLLLLLLTLFGFVEVDKSREWLMSVGKRYAWRDCSPLPELCLSALVSFYLRIKQHIFLHHLIKGTICQIWPRIFFENEL